MATLSLVEEIMDIKPEFKEKFKKYVPLLVDLKLFLNLIFKVKVLKNLVSSYSGDYEISGIIDPFLQVYIRAIIRIKYKVQIITLFGRLGEKNEAISEEINDVLTQVKQKLKQYFYVSNRLPQTLQQTKTQETLFCMNALEQS